MERNQHACRRRGEGGGPVHGAMCQWQCAGGHQRHLWQGVGTCSRPALNFGMEEAARFCHLKLVSHLCCQHTCPQGYLATLSSALGLMGTTATVRLLQLLMCFLHLNLDPSPFRTPLDVPAPLRWHGRADGVLRREATHRMMAGVCYESLALEVAEEAGMPARILERARRCGLCRRTLLAGTCCYVTPHSKPTPKGVVRQAAVLSGSQQHEHADYVWVLAST